MLFKLNTSLIDFHVVDLNEGESVDFDFNGPHQITASLSIPSASEVKDGHQVGNAFCKVTGSWKISESINSVFNTLIINQLPQGAHDELIKFYFATKEITPNGHFASNFIVPLKVLPDTFQSFAKEVHMELLDFTRQTVRVLRWRHNLTGPHNPITIRNFWWSPDNQQWKLMPSMVEMSIEALGILNQTNVNRTEIEKLVQNGGFEPLGHEVFREAWYQRHQNPRSAIIIGIAAAEIGIKNYVGFLIPDAQWLVDNLQSPSLGKILRKYLPNLPTKLSIQDKPPAIPIGIIKAIEDGVELRNNIAHLGTAKFDYKKLEEILLAVKDLLWILDYYCGHIWALEHVRRETRNALENLNDKGQ
jgi:hypothetical protein